MSDKKPTQKTKPKEGKPVEIPVPERAKVLEDLEKAMAPSRESATKSTKRRI